MALSSLMHRFVFVVVVGVSFVGTHVFALVNTKLPTGVNHASAHRYATGQGVTVGVFDTPPYGILSPNLLGDRLLAQYSFVGKSPSQSPDPLTTLSDDHERLAADIVAGGDPLFTGVAPAAFIYDAAIDTADLHTQRAASNWLNANHGVEIFSLSADFGTNTNGTSPLSIYWDWFIRDKDVLLAVAAGNSGSQLVIPADAYNGIAVGAYDQANLTRWPYSAFTMNGPDSEVRGKPDILAPGVWVGDGISFGGFYAQGTSFAAPHVAGTAALLTDYGNLHPTADTLGHRGLKALILNSARKRQIVGPEALSATSADYSGGHFFNDKDYLACSPAGCTIANPATAGPTAAWTPVGWNFAAGKLSITKPLDDEQGVGYLDATRAIINLAGGNAGPGTVPGIGWDQGIIQTTDLPAAHTYALGQALAAGSFLTATLTWDRMIVEGDGNGTVDDIDTYTFGEFANLDLQLLDALDQVVAESISLTDNVEHLHLPLPTNGAPGDYKLQVIDRGGHALATDFAIAWWTDPTPLVPGDYNRDGTVDVLDYQVWRAGFANSTDVSPLVRGDGNADGTVDAADYAIWRKHLGETWSGIDGSGGGSHSVPEPTSVLTVALASLGFFTLRCRHI